jgi:hypothetical protein
VTTFLLNIMLDKVLQTMSQIYFTIGLIYQCHFKRHL